MNNVSSFLANFGMKLLVNGFATFVNTGYENDATRFLKRSWWRRFRKII